MGKEAANGGLFFVFYSIILVPNIRNYKRHSVYLYQLNNQKNT